MLRDGATWALSPHARWRGRSSPLADAREDAERGVSSCTWTILDVLTNTPEIMPPSTDSTDARQSAFLKSVAESEGAGMIEP